METPNKVNKSLEIAKSVNAEVQKIVDSMFLKAEVDRSKDEVAYFAASNTIFAAIIACAAQKMLTDGLNRRRVGSKTYAGANLAWELFLANNPGIAMKVADEKAKHSLALVDDIEQGDDSDESDESDGEEDTDGLNDEE